MSHGMSFWEAFPLLKSGILGSVMVASLCGVLGVYVVLKRIVFVSAALSQVSSLGMSVYFVLAGFLGSRLGHEALAPHGRSRFWEGPLFCSILFAGLAALALGRQLMENRLSRESVLGIAYTLPASLVLILLDKAARETHDVENILFGNAVFVSSEKLWLLAGTLAALLVFHRFFHKEWIYVSFDPETAQASGIPVFRLNQGFFLLLAWSISVSIFAIGALPVFGFLVVPAASGLLLSGRLGIAFWLSTGFAMASAFLGFYVSFVYSIPTGAAMLTAASACLVPGVVLRQLVRTS